MTWYPPRSLMLLGLTAALLTPNLACRTPVRRTADHAMPRMFPHGAPPAREVTVVDLRQADDDLRLAAITLQGLLNRPPEAEVFCLQKPQDETWFNRLLEKGYVRAFQRATPRALLETRGGAARCAVIPDPGLPATLNVATMVAAAEDGFVVPVSVLETGLVPADLPHIDLRGRWTTNADAYAWAYAEYGDRLNPRLLASYHPTFNRHALRDYMVCHRAFVFWASGEHLQDRPEVDPERERALVEELLAGTPVNVPVIGWWGAGDVDHGLSEYGGVGLAGRYGKITHACDWAANFSFLSGVPATPRPMRETPPPTPATVQAQKVYLSFVVMESGDAPAYWYDVQEHVWNDPARGTIPIAWTLAPASWELLPSVMEWFREQATPLDEFTLALSGAGYVHPYREFLTRTPDPEAAWKEYLGLTSAYARAYGLDSLGLYTDAWFPFDRSLRDPVTERFAALPGIEILVLGMGRDGDALPNNGFYRLGPSGTWVAHVGTRWDPANVGRSPANNAWLAQEIRDRVPEDRDGPVFIVVHPLSWSYHPSDLVDVMDRLGPDYQAVPLHALHDLWTQADPDCR